MCSLRQQGEQEGKNQSPQFSGNLKDIKSVNSKLQVSAVKTKSPRVCSQIPKGGCDILSGGTGSRGYRNGQQLGEPHTRGL